jgi:hypothetical protein
MAKDGSHQLIYLSVIWQHVQLLNAQVPYQQAGDSGVVVRRCKCNHATPLDEQCIHLPDAMSRAHLSFLAMNAGEL